MFEKLILNPYVKNALKQYMDKGQKNAQHLILSGPQGTGKRTCADILAHFLLDIRLDKPLHSCADFFCLDCDQASIKLSDTEDLREFISYSSTVRRVVLIDNANQMTPNVANSLLKELEDGQCVFIFIAHKPLIRTVCSRCFEIRFLPVNEDDMAQFFMEQGDLVSLEVVTASNGCPGLFRQLNADDAFISMTARMIKALNQQNHADPSVNLRSPERKRRICFGSIFTGRPSGNREAFGSHPMQINTCINLLEANYSRI